MLLNHHTYFHWVSSRNKRFDPRVEFRQCNRWEPISTINIDDNRSRAGAQKYCAILRKIIIMTFLMQNEWLQYNILLYMWKTSNAIHTIILYKTNYFKDVFYYFVYFLRRREIVPFILFLLWREFHIAGHWPRTNPEHASVWWINPTATVYG